MTRLLLTLAGPAVAAGAVLIILAVQLDQGLGTVYFLGVALLLIGLLGQLLRGLRQKPREERTTIPVAAPVRGRWRGLNSPASKVPSHTHSLAQTYALDITYEPVGAAPRALDPWSRPMRRPTDFPSFGQPVLAPFDGVVLAARGTARDHLTRLSPLGLGYLILEGFVRSLGLPRHLLGNHVLLRATGPVAADGSAAEGSSAEGGAVHGDGDVVAVLAHLRRGSLRVSPGDQVSAGDLLAECGNSGNSSDPHVHFQLMDGPDIVTARGLPFTWHYRDEDGQAVTGVPANEELFTAS
ncbi:M23 family metallopeptidase [Brachybacterium sp.]|uniref:M23 family metallopeptidase n=1 Tax=Brachybacterium sp. TaxID=1891286 RepID=UPI002ED3C7F0